ncbi:MAG: glycosyltransferase [Peptostreptococcaceae bacterium]
MRILHIITQKPNSTGSGIYMSGMINGFDKLGYKQGVIAGIDKYDSNECFNKNINFYPVVYNTEELPFNVVGMSDIMPYKSTTYKSMNLEMVEKLKMAFRTRIDKAISEIKPDLIICHHLYLITAFVREIIKDIPVVGISHGTCLKQIQSHDLQKNYIKKNIGNLNMIFSLHDEQKKDIIDIFEVNDQKVFSLGSGYDENMFFNKTINNEIINITFAGKICKLKGVESLIKSLEKVDYPKSLININIVGDGSDKKEYENILNIAKKSKFNINFLGKIKQQDLANLFRHTHIFILPSFFEGLPLVVIEALASGCNVITTDIPGVSKWIGEEINTSGKIKYIDLPNMKEISIPIESELFLFEESLGVAINENIESILTLNTRNKLLDMKDKTWIGLCNRLKSFIDFSEKFNEM